MDENENSGTYMSKDSSFGNALASSTFSAPDPIRVFSMFGDGDTGEPLEAHHLCLDFTPTDDDDDYSQKKCCEFWKYIASRSDLQDMMVLPEPELSSQSTDSDSVPKPSPKTRTPRPKTAVSVLQIVEEKGLIDRAFEAKMQQSRCTLGSQDYELSPKEEDSTAKALFSDGCFNTEFLYEIGSLSPVRFKKIQLEPNNLSIIYVIPVVRVFMPKRSYLYVYSPSTLRGIGDLGHQPSKIHGAARSISHYLGRISCILQQRN